MADLGEDLRSFLLATSGVASLVGERVHQDHVPQDRDGEFDGPYVWFQQRSVEYWEATDDEAGVEPAKVFYDLECVADTQADAKSLADAVRTRHLFRGAGFGGRTVKGVFVQDQSDEYIPRNVMGDDGPFVSALSLEVIP